MDRPTEHARQAGAARPAHQQPDEHQKTAVAADQQEYVARRGAQRQFELIFMQGS